MNVRHNEITIELTGDDLAHLLKSGTSTVTDTDTGVQAKVKCRDSATVNVTVGDSEDTNDE